MSRQALPDSRASYFNRQRCVSSIHIISFPDAAAREIGLRTIEHTSGIATITEELDLVSGTSTLCSEVLEMI